MAYENGKSGSFVIHGTKDLDFKVYWEETYDLAANKSILVLKPYCIIQSSGGGVRYWLKGTISCDGTQLVDMQSVHGTHYFEGAYHIEKPIQIGGVGPDRGQNLVLTSGEITHNADGTRDVVIAANFTGYSEKGNGINAFKVDGSVTITLTSIPRAATVASAQNFNDEQNPTITYSNPAGTAVASLRVCITNTTGSSIYVPYRDISKTDTSYTFSLTDDERDALRLATPDSRYLPVKFCIETVIGSEPPYRNYSEEKTMTIVNAEPELSIMVLDTNDKTVGLTGNRLLYVVKGYSNMAYEIIANAAKGASITSYSAKCGSDTKTTSSGVFEKALSGTFSFTVADSRRFSETVTRNINLINYFKPTCSVECKLELDTETTVKAAIKIAGTFFNGNIGATKNSLDIYIKHSQTSDWVSIKSFYGDYTTNGNNYSVSFDISGLNYKDAFVYQVRVEDKLDSVQTDEKSISYLPVFDWSGEDFNFNVPVTIQGNPIVDYVVEEGTEAMGSNGTWYWRKWASGKADCYGVRNYGNMAVSTAWGSLYYSQKFTQSLPSGLLTEEPSFCSIMFAGSSSDYAAWIATAEMPTKSASSAFYVMRPTSATIQQAKISFNVIGKWK